MFTGLIEDCGEVADIIDLGQSYRLTIFSSFSDLSLGESISVNGVCLTVMSIDGRAFTVEVSPETINITNCQLLAKGSQVNLERALRLGDRLGGHFVLGHVDQTARVVGLNQQDEFIELAFAGIQSENLALLVKKGSVAVNGVSLTINALSHDGFTVMLIPHTLQLTNLKTLQIGSIVNIEFDWMLKTIVSQCQNRLELCGIGVR